MLGDDQLNPQYRQILYKPGIEIPQAKSAAIGFTATDIVILIKMLTVIFGTFLLIFTIQKGLHKRYQRHRGPAGFAIGPLLQLLFHADKGVLDPYNICQRRCENVCFRRFTFIDLWR